MQLHLIGDGSIQAMLGQCCRNRGDAEFLRIGDDALSQRLGIGQLVGLSELYRLSPVCRQPLFSAKLRIDEVGSRIDQQIGVIKVFISADIEFSLSKATWCCR